MGRQCGGELRSVRRAPTKSNRTLTGARAPAAFAKTAFSAGVRQRFPKLRGATRRRRRSGERGPILGRASPHAKLVFNQRVDTAMALASTVFNREVEREHEALMLVLGDVLIHTWDLARATGQDETLDRAWSTNCSPAWSRSTGSSGVAVSTGPASPCLLTPTSKLGSSPSPDASHGAADPGAAGGAGTLVNPLLPQDRKPRCAIRPLSASTSWSATGR